MQLNLNNVNAIKKENDLKIQINDFVKIITIY